MLNENEVRPSQSCSLYGGTTIPSRPNDSPHLLNQINTAIQELDVIDIRPNKSTETPLYKNLTDLKNTTLKLSFWERVKDFFGLSETADNQRDVACLYTFGLFETFWQPKRTSGPHDYNRASERFMQAMQKAGLIPTQKNASVAEQVADTLVRMLERNPHLGKENNTTGKRFILDKAVLEMADSTANDRAICLRGTVTFGPPENGNGPDYLQPLPFSVTIASHERVSNRSDPVLDALHIATTELDENDVTFRTLFSNLESPATRDTANPTLTKALFAEGGILSDFNPEGEDVILPPDDACMFRALLLLNTRDNKWSNATKDEIRAEVDKGKSRITSLIAKACQSTRDADLDIGLSETMDARALATAIYDATITTGDLTLYSPVGIAAAFQNAGLPVPGGDTENNETLLTLADSIALIITTEFNMLTTKSGGLAYAICSNNHYNLWVPDGYFNGEPVEFTFAPSPTEEAMISAEDEVTDARNTEQRIIFSRRGIQWELPSIEQELNNASSVVDLNQRAATYTEMDAQQMVVLMNTALQTVNALAIENLNVQTAYDAATTFQQQIVNRLADIYPLANAIKEAMQAKTRNNRIWQNAYSASLAANQRDYRADNAHLITLGKQAELARLRAVAAGVTNADNKNFTISDDIQEDITSWGACGMTPPFALNLAGGTCELEWMTAVVAKNNYKSMIDTIKAMDHDAIARANEEMGSASENHRQAVATLDEKIAEFTRITDGIAWATGDTQSRVYTAVNAIFSTIEQRYSLTRSEADAAINLAIAHACGKISEAEACLTWAAAKSAIRNTAGISEMPLDLPAAITAANTKMDQTIASIMEKLANGNRLANTKTRQAASAPPAASANHAIAAGREALAALNTASTAKTQELLTVEQRINRLREAVNTPLSYPSWGSAVPNTSDLEDWTPLSPDTHEGSAMSDTTDLNGWELIG